MVNRLQVLKMYKLFIGGKFTRTESERYITIYSKKNKEKLCNISRASRKDLRNAVVSARTALGVWTDKSAYERGQILYRLAEMLESRKEQFVYELIRSEDITKNAAVKEVEYSIDRIIWYAGASDKWIQANSTVNPVQNGYFNFSIPEPVGVVVVILPDDKPLLSFVSRICPVIVSGNTCIVITPDGSPLPAMSFSEVISTSDVPGGVINILTGKKDELIKHISEHMDVNSINFCNLDKDRIRSIKEYSSLNVKRVNYTEIYDFYDNNLNENFYEIYKFTEIKTVWHTMGY